MFAEVFSDVSNAKHFVYTSSCDLIKGSQVQFEGSINFTPIFTTQIIINLSLFL